MTSPVKFLTNYTGGVLLPPPVQTGLAKHVFGNMKTRVFQFYLSQKFSKRTTWSYTDCSLRKHLVDRRLWLCRPTHQFLRSHHTTITTNHNMKKQREGQELDIRMCCNHIKSEPKTQTFTLHSRPIPLCVVEYVKLTPHWQLDETCAFSKMVSRMTWRHFHVQEDIWTSVYTHESQSNNPTKTSFVGSSQRQWGGSFTPSWTHDGLGRATTRKSFL